MSIAKLLLSEDKTNVKLGWLLKKSTKITMNKLKRELIKELVSQVVYILKQYSSIDDLMRKSNLFYVEHFNGCLFDRFNSLGIFKHKLSSYYMYHHTHIEKRYELRIGDSTLKSNVILNYKF
jgi:hypothetical protein